MTKAQRREAYMTNMENFTMAASAIRKAKALVCRPMANDMVLVEALARGLCAEDGKNADEKVLSPFTHRPVLPRWFVEYRCEAKRFLRVIDALQCKNVPDRNDSLTASQNQRNPI